MKFGAVVSQELSTQKFEGQAKISMSTTNKDDNLFCYGYVSPLVIVTDKILYKTISSTKFYINITIHSKIL